MILVDTNVLLDILADDPVWFEWSRARLDAALLIGPLVCNDVIVAELSPRFDTLAALETVLDHFGLVHQEMPMDALFLAGKAFQNYRRLGGTRTKVLADFFIGAHAMAGGIPLLTRDSRRYRSYFPQLDLIAPDLSAD